MMTDSRCRVWGTCSDSLGEDLCAKLNIPTKMVAFCPRNTYIHIELLDCTEISAELLGQWRKLDVHHNDQVFMFERLFVGQAPVEFSSHGPSFQQEPAVAIRFVPFTRVN